jgi:hypothetical protein
VGRARKPHRPSPRRRKPPTAREARASQANSEPTPSLRRRHLAVPEGWLLDLKATARYLSLSPDTVRALWWVGTLSRVRAPTRQGELRKLLFGRVDPGRLIEAWKGPPRSSP